MDVLILYYFVSPNLSLKHVGESMYVDDLRLYTNFMLLLVCV
jgi:hypothetical protein